MNNGNENLNNVEIAVEVQEQQPEYGVSSVTVVKKKKDRLKSFYEYLETFCYALVAMILLFLFVIRLVTVDGTSMKTTLDNGDKLIISNLFYTPETGDIVVIKADGVHNNGAPLIKRIIATEGQTVYIDYENWAVYVDGVKLDEPYIEGMRTELPMRKSIFEKYNSEFVVGEGKVFVMGDNRNNSTDSRQLGEISANRILGYAVLRLTPDFGLVE